MLKHAVQLLHAGVQGRCGIGAILFLHFLHLTLCKLFGLALLACPRGHPYLLGPGLCLHVSKAGLKKHEETVFHSVLLFQHVSACFDIHMPLHPSTFLCRILLKGSMSSLRCEPLPVHHGSPLLSLQAQLKSNTAILSFLFIFGIPSSCHLSSQHGTWGIIGGVRFSFVQSQRAIVKHLKTSDIFWPQSGDCSAQQHSWHDHNWGYSEPWRAKDHVLFAILEDVAEASTCREREQTQFVSSFLQVLFWVCSVFNQTKQANCLLWIADYVMKMSMWWICDEYVCLLSLLYFESRNDLSFGLALCGIGRKSLPAGAD